jgi:hypothetical protein
VVGWALGNRLGLRAGLGALKLLADSLDGRSAGVGDAVTPLVQIPGGYRRGCHLRSGTAEVGVNTGKDLAVVGLDILDNNAASNAVLAVTASAVQLAEVHNLETVDGNGALAVVLDDLVVSGLGTSAFDHGVAVALEGESIFANVDPPNVLVAKLAENLGVGR